MRAFRYSVDGLFYDDYECNGKFDVANQLFAPPKSFADIDGLRELPDGGAEFWLSNGLHLVVRSK